DRALDEGANLGDDLGDVATGLGDQRGSGGDAVHHAGGDQVLDDGDVGGVEEEFHGDGVERPTTGRASQLLPHRGRGTMRSMVDGASPRHWRTRRAPSVTARRRAAPPPPTGEEQVIVASILIPLPVPEAFDYEVPEGLELARGDQATVP